MLEKRLIYLRKQRNKTQQDMANTLGVTRPAYTAYESGTRKPDYGTLQKIADYFDVTTDYLLNRSDDPNQIEDKDSNSIEELKQFMIKNNMEDMDQSFCDIEKWKQLSREDIEDVKKHFEYVLHRAQERNKEDN